MNRADRLAAFPYSAYRIQCNAWDMGEMQVMRDRGFDRIVFVSSVSAERGGGLFGGVAYSAAKAAELGFARALARELGPNGVTVNSVAPGFIEIESAEGCLPASARSSSQIPVGRGGHVNDVADLITFLCR
jgi:NAD(P)-dependent dehydrogenase (short-subunit alcohol dehydrogenase family)